MSAPVLAGVRDMIGRVPDPEIPVLTIEDLGVLRDVRQEGAALIVEITPTYSGCPAMTQIADDIAEVLEAAGVSNHEVRLVHYPAWTTDWISAEAREKLLDYGISPPGGNRLCPNCRETNTRMVALFGSTACKALVICESCGEPFDYFKEF